MEELLKAIKRRNRECLDEHETHENNAVKVERHGLKMKVEFKNNEAGALAREMWAKLNKPIKYKGEKRKWQKRNTMRFIRLKF